MLSHTARWVVPIWDFDGGGVEPLGGAFEPSEPLILQRARPPCSYSPECGLVAINLFKTDGHESDGQCGYVTSKACSVLYSWRIASVYISFQCPRDNTIQYNRIAFMFVCDCFGRSSQFRRLSTGTGTGEELLHIDILPFIPISNPAKTFIHQPHPHPKVSH